MGYIYRVGETVTIAAAFVNGSGVGVASLTVTVDVDKPDHTAQVTGAAVAEARNGIYYYTFTAATAGCYLFAFKTTSIAVSRREYQGRIDVVAVNAAPTLSEIVAAIPAATQTGLDAQGLTDTRAGYLDNLPNADIASSTIPAATAALIPTAVQNAEAQLDHSLTGHGIANTPGAVFTAATPTRLAKLDQIGAGAVFVNSPLDPATKKVTIIYGDAYLEADGRAVEFIDTDDTWIDLSEAGLTVAVYVKLSSGTLAYAGTPVLGGAHQMIRVELTTDQSKMLQIAPYGYEVKATRLNGDVITVSGLEGPWLVVPFAKS